MRQRPRRDDRGHRPPARRITAVELTTRVLRAIERRAALLAAPGTDCCRLVHDAADGLDGLVLERFGDVLIAQLHEGRLCADQRDVAAACEQARERLGARAVYAKVFARDRSAALASLHAAHSEPTPWLGQPVEPEITCRESGMRFLIRPYDGYSVGLFLENRDNRQRVRDRSAGRRVLNTFAYTGGFTLAAARGGAESITSVDLAGKALDVARRNLALNELDGGRRRWVRGEVLDYLARAARRGEQYDLVILDPPTFARAKRVRRPFVLGERLDELLDGAARLLDEGGELLFCTNLRELPEHVLRQALGRRFRTARRLDLPADFAGDETYSRSFWCGGRVPGG